MSAHSVHTTLTSTLFVMQILFLVFLSISMFALGLPLFGALVGFATICLALTTGVAVIKHSSHLRSEQLSLGDVINRILANSTNPMSVFTKDDHGRMVLLYTNTDELVCIEDYFQDIDPLERVILEDTIQHGKPASTNILSKRENGDLAEYEVVFIPVASDDNPSRYIITSKNKIKDISANVISLNSVRQKLPE